jgi:hypothetical protein
MRSKGEEYVGGKFWTGVLTGVFATVFLMTLVGYYVIKVNGVAVAIDQNMMAKTVQEKVQAEVAKELPVLLTQVKQEVPKAIAKNMSDFDQVSIQIGSGKFPLPAEATQVFKEEFQGMAEKAVINTIDTFQVDPYVRQIGDASYTFVKKTLHDEILGKKFSFQANRWLTLPVTVQGK